MRQLLIIFPPTMHPEPALNAFLEQTKSIQADVFIFCSSFISFSKIEYSGYKLYQQLGDDKVEAIMNAFLKAFLRDYERVLFVDLDGNEFSEDEIKHAFDSQKNVEVVLDFDEDKNLVLLGMKNLYSQIFEGEMKANQVMGIMEKQDIAYLMLPKVRRKVSD